MDQITHNSLLGLQLPELAALVEEFGQPPTGRASCLKRFTVNGLKPPSRSRPCPRIFAGAWLQKGISIGLPGIEKKFVSSDGTVRYLVACADGQTVETVWMPEGDGGETGDGSDAGDETDAAGANLGTSHDLCLQPGRLRGRLPVLPDRSARHKTKPDCRRNRRAGVCGA